MRSKFMRVITALASVALAGLPAIRATPAEAPTIRVEDAWIRWLPAGVPAGGYATLTNTGEKSLRLIAVSSPAFGEVSIHRSVEHQGMMEMRPVAQIAIVAHSSLNFAATGYHLMLVQPSKPLALGDHVPMTLHFAGGGSLTVQFEVRK
ncbi:MAG TPA: copper chaperone PCu(A)C [Steroidobacteraceae bacterium]|nr:copper chaperone PCu(A)C [Steroidobacteraceae bacterium]